jgi:flagellin
MSLNSINTNTSSMIALQSLEQTQSELAVTQKQISTGYRVSDSTDDGAAYAIAQSVRSTVGALTSANQQLGDVQGLLSTTQSALNDVSNTMASMRDVLVKLSDQDVQGNDRSNYISQYNSLLGNLKSFISDATYNGKSLINDLGSSTINHIAVVQNEVGGTYGIATFSGTKLYNSITFSGVLGQTTNTTAANSAAALITASGSFIKWQNSVGAELNTIGGSINYVNNQVTYNNDKISALNTGLGALIDADLAQESAQLTALQIRQQLGTQALSMANQAPQSLLSLFK